MNRLEAILPFADALNVSVPFYCVMFGKGILEHLLSNLIISEKARAKEIRDLTKDPDLLHGIATWHL